MTYNLQFIRLRVVARVAWIEFNRAPVNAFNREMAVAGISVGNHPGIDGANESRHAIQHLTVGCYAGIGKPVCRRRHPIAGRIDEIEADLVADHGGDHVMQSRRDDKLAGLDSRLQTSLAHLRTLFSRQSREESLSRSRYSHGAADL